MMLPSATASPWPARLAYCAAGIFISASGGTNIAYGWAKGSDPITSTIWAAVAGGVAIVFALSWPALIRSVEARRWSAAVMALAALLLAGGYSVTAALGSAAGGRMQAAATETAVTSTRDRAQAAYDRAQAELAKIGPARPAAELEGLLSAARQTCRVFVSDGRRQTVCAPNAPLTAELGRARQRDRLQADVDRAAEALAAAPPKVANSDARALARYLAAAGLDVGADRLNDLLVLLAVLMIEAGGGLSLALGMALSAPAIIRPAVPTEAAGRSDQPKPAPEAAPAAHPAMSAARPAIVTDIRPDFGRPRWTDGGQHGRPAESEAVVAWLRAAGGRTVGIRPMADALGWPRTTLTERLQRLAGQGLVTLAPGRRGTVVELAGAVRAN